jgi:hypothetical protein
MKVDLEDKTVFVRLTNEAVGALQGLVPPGTGFTAWVAAEKPYGLWMDIEGTGSGASDRLVLIKWAHLQTMTIMQPRQTKPGAGRKN